MRGCGGVFGSPFGMSRVWGMRCSIRLLDEFRGEKKERAGGGIEEGSSVGGCGSV